MKRLILALALYCACVSLAQAQIYNPPQMPDWASTNPAVVRTNLGLGANDSVTFAGITNTGNAVMGDAAGDSVTVNAGSFTAPNATAPDGVRVMTRDLVDSQRMFAPTVRFLGLLSSSGSGGSGSMSQGEASVYSGTNNGGYGFVNMAQVINGGSGAGVLCNFNLPFSIRINASAGQPGFDASGVVRILIAGIEANYTRLADVPALANKGWGVEIGPATNQVRGIRIVSHDGTNYTAGAWAGSFLTSSTDGSFSLILENAGGGVMRVYATAGGPWRAPSRTPILTATNGPVGTTGSGGFFFAAVNPSTNALPMTTAAKLYGGAEVLNGPLVK